MQEMEDQDVGPMQRTEHKSDGCNEQWQEGQAAQEHNPRP